MVEVNEKFFKKFFVYKFQHLYVCLKSGHLTNIPNTKTMNYFNGGQ